MPSFRSFQSKMGYNYPNGDPVDFQVRIERPSRLSSRETKIQSADVKNRMRSNQSVPEMTVAVVTRGRIDYIMSRSLDDLRYASMTVVRMKLRAYLLQAYHVRIDLPDYIRHSLGIALQV
jgi:hypothetical protein